MPPVSEKQRRAMYAAAEGKSTLGIPQKVGEEFVGKTDESISTSSELVNSHSDIHAAGIDEIEKYRTELDVARAIRDGKLSSPQQFGNMWLFDIRITGTGTAYRTKGDETVYRPPEHYLTDEFLQRCNGLLVIWQHPNEGVLNTEEFIQRTIGTIFLPYLKENCKEVWGIAKIYDKVAADNMIARPLSTSPTVVFQKLDGSETVNLIDGTELLIEGNPSLLDHVAICDNGVWDKGNEPNGIVVSDDNNLESGKMSDKKEEVIGEKREEIKKDNEGENFDLAKKFEELMGMVSKLASDVEALKGREKAEESVPVDSKLEAHTESVPAPVLRPEMEAMDNEIKKRIDAVENMMPRKMSDAEYAEMADCQARADSVANLFGESVTRPQIGETVLAYRKRVLSKFKKHSPTYKDIDLDKVADDSLFSIVEKNIYSDATHAANNPVLFEGETLREIKTRSPAGHQISTFKGDISSWTNGFKANAYKLNTINKGVQ